MKLKIINKLKKTENMTNETKYTVRIQNLKSGETFFENQFDSREEAAEFMNSYPDEDNMLYRVVEESVTEWIKEVNKYFVISYSFGDNVEYYNSAMVHDDFSTKLIENAEGFETEQDAKDVLENTIKPYAEKKGWEVAFFIDETY